MPHMEKRNKKASRAALLLLLFILLVVSGCAKKTEEPVTKEFFAMDTVMAVTVYGEDAEKACTEASAEVYRLEGLLSTENDSSEIALVNREGSGTLTADGARVLRCAMELYEETGGLFDITVYPVMELWGFPSKEYHVPAKEELASALSHTDASGITVSADGDGDFVVLKEGMKIDLGGIAKGYASEKITELLRERGTEHALVNLGGNVQVLGTKPDGSPWRIAIRDPEDAQGMIGVLETADRAVVTSGGYERFFEENGKTYHHIIDPRTGYPAESGLLSATAVCPDGTKADGLSTSLFIMGKDEAAAFWRAHKEEFEFILVTDEREIFISEGLAGSFTSDFPFSIVR